MTSAETARMVMDFFKGDIAERAAKRVMTVGKDQYATDGDSHQKWETLTCHELAEETRQELEDGGLYLSGLRVRFGRSFGLWLARRRVAKVHAYLERKWPQ